MKIENEENVEAKKPTYFPKFLEVICIIAIIASIVFLIAGIRNSSDDTIWIGIIAILSSLLFLTFAEILHALIDIYNKLPNKE